MADPLPMRPIHVKGRVHFVFGCQPKYPRGQTDKKKLPWSHPVGRSSYVFLSSDSASKKEAPDCGAVCTLHHPVVFFDLWGTTREVKKELPWCLPRWMLWRILRTSSTIRMWNVLVYPPFFQASKNCKLCKCQIVVILTWGTFLIWQTKHIPLAQKSVDFW